MCCVKCVFVTPLSSADSSGAHTAYRTTTRSKRNSLWRISCDTRGIPSSLHRQQAKYPVDLYVGAKTNTHSYSECAVSIFFQNVSSIGLCGNKDMNIF